MEINALPKITIITPSLNQADFIEQTIQSVLSQGYPNLEYLVMDGGSTDDTLSILRKYEDRLTWFSEKDRGQSDAINKGLRIATGEIVAFLNSDDTYIEGALCEVGKYFASHPEAYWLTGKCRNINFQGDEIRPWIRRYKNFWGGFKSQWVLSILNYISQPATFWRRAVVDDIGFFNEGLHLTMDYEYWLRMRQHYKLHYLNRYLANFRIYPNSKSGSTFKKQFDEELEVSLSYSDGVAIFLHRIHRMLTIWCYRRMF